MNLNNKDWNRYVKKLSSIHKTAGKRMQHYILKEGFDDPKKLVDYAYELTQTYGAASASTAARMYEAIGYLQKAGIATPELAASATYGEVAKAVYGTAKHRNIELVAGAVERLVKRQGADTIMHNAIRDKAEWAWIPSGDSCAFCEMIASQGWLPASKEQLAGGHADHIHAHCDCTFAIRFDDTMDIKDYDPDSLRDKYDAAEGHTWRDKVNSMRRDNYAENKDEINAAKRQNYADRMEVKNE